MRLGSPSSALRNTDPSGLGFAVVVVGIAVAVGLLAGVDPRLAIAAALAIALLVVTMESLLAGLAGFIVLSFLELVPSLTGPTLSLSKVAGAVLVLSWLASSSRWETRRRQFPSDHPWLTAGLVLLVAWTAASVIWAEDGSRVFTPTASYALNFALFPLVYAAIRKPADARLVLGAFVVGAGVAAIYGVLSQPNAAALVTSPVAAQGLNRLAGTIGDPNELATLLAAGIGLSTAIIFNPRVSGPVRMTFVLIDLAMLASIFITLSRGGLVALAAALVAGVFATVGRSRVGSVLAIASILAVAFGFYFGVASPEARDRITDQDGGSGRTDIWKVGWRMVEDQPVIGVGAGNFQVASIHYLLAPGVINFDEYIVDQPTVAHNAYLQVLAETGLVGLALFVILLLGCLIAAGRAIRMFRRLDDEEGALVAAATLVGIAALLAGYVFLSEQYSKQLWLLLAIGPALLGVARRRTAEAATAGSAERA